MSTHNLKWVDVVSQVEKANIEAHRALKVRERKINQSFIANLDRDVQIHHLKKLKITADKTQERLSIQLQAQQEWENLKRQKYQASMRQKAYGDKNLQLVQLSKLSKTPQTAYRQHPFVSLLDEQEWRQRKYRQKLEKQNEVNLLQEKIKQHQLRDQKVRDKDYRDRFVSHVEMFYAKKDQDRNLFKRKYLKMTNPERSQVQLRTETNCDQSVEREYENYNKNKAQQHRQGKSEKDTVDTVLGHINKHIENPNSSPAYLGRIPSNNDRKMQLQYLQKSINSKKHGNDVGRRLKTVGDVEDRQTQERRYISHFPQLPSLEKYCNDISRDELIEKRTSKISKHEPFASVPQSLKPTTNKSVIPQRSSSFVPQANGHSAIRKQERKAFATYDIIQGKNKYFYI